MGKYKYIIFERYPNNILSNGVIWAFSEKHAHKRLRRLAENKFYVVYK